MKDVDDRYRPPFEALSASTDGPNLQAMREILYLESLYGDEVDYKLHVGRREPNLRALREILYLESLYGAAIDYREHRTGTDFGTVVSVISSFGLTFSVGICISLVLNWAIQWAMKAFGN